MRATRSDGTAVELHEDGTWSVIGSGGALVPDTGTEDPGGFRGVPWGSSRSQAITREGRDPSVRKDDYMMWDRIPFDGYEWLASYNYLDDVLFRGFLALTSKLSTAHAHLTEYYSARDLLIRRFGEPTEERELWGDDTFKSRGPDFWPKAIEYGDLTLATEWAFAGTLVNLQVFGSDGTVSLGIHYRSTELAETYDERQRSADLDEL
jgi:hypothetical protein